MNRALRIDPTHYGATFNLGLLHLRQNRFEQALKDMQRAKQLDPSLRNVESYMLFSLNYRADVDAEAVARAHRCVGEAITQAAGRSFSTWENRLDPERRLRMGQAGAARVRELFSAERMVRQLETLYRGMVAKHSAV